MVTKTLEEFEKEGYLKRDDFLFTLEDYYFIYLTPRTLKYYSSIGLIDPRKKENVKGKKGSVSLYHKKNLDTILLIKWLQIYLKITLVQLSEYFNVLRFDKTAYQKFKRVLKKYNEGDPEEKLDKIIDKDKEIDWTSKSQAEKEKLWAESMSRVYKFNKNMWKEEENFFRVEAYIREFCFIVKNLALIETGLLGIGFKGSKMDKYLSSAEPIIWSWGKNCFRVIFKKPINKEVTFFKDKIEVVDLKSEGKNN